ncbi:MAG: hypothetical protein R2881_03850 [Eubacteriales bacterium]
MMRIIDVIYSSDLLIVILLSATLKDPLEALLQSSAVFSGISELGPAFFSMLIVFGLMYWGTMRVSCAARCCASRSRVRAGGTLGANSSRIRPPSCFTELHRPDHREPATLQIPAAIFTDHLSFIGAGISAPLLPLGSMVTGRVAGHILLPDARAVPSLIIALIIQRSIRWATRCGTMLNPRMKK